MFSTELHAVKVDSLRARLPLAFIDEDQWYTIWFDVTELMNYCFHEQLTRITAIKIEQGARLRRVLSLGGSRHLPAKWALPATLNANEVKINALVLADLEAARASATGLDLTTSMLMDRSDGTIIAGRLPAPPSSGSNSRPARSPRRGRMVRSGDKAGRPVRDSVKWPVHETATSGVKPSGQEQRGANDGMERGDSRHVNSHIVARAPESRPASDTPPTDSSAASQGVLVGAAMSAAAGAVNEDEEDEEGQRPTFTSSSLLASRAPSDAATSLLEDLVRQGLQVETGPGLLDLSGFKVAEEDFLVDDTWRYEDDDEDKSRKEHGVADVQRDDLDSDEDLPLASRPMHRSSHDTISLDDGDGNGGEALSAGLRRGLKQPSSSRGSTTMSTSGEGHALTPRPTGLQRRESDVASTRSSVTVAAQARLSLANVHGGEDDVVLRRQDNIGTPNPGHLHATDLMWEDDWDTRWSPEPSHLDSSDSEDEDQASSLFDSDMRRRAGSLSELESSFSSVGRSISRTADASLREVIYDPGLNCYYDPATNQYFQLA
ncbi:uncharacterized protein MONBRDRAFT_31654 [Monosiga brevicollis MX1]|uniref:CFA20 domain-containing protein n=1 Tax=Monosiga brevicollis TaxID=81824 RepID=A9UUY2_MONBE|nr:uncharacterized protein MONBRDRAFT_31654 [Monosiga brevicollis MX1]EDQ90988.1 predicted protein [Monosiga brevicollis MX1]|eukprot:XP_001744285.1 hypothetical protein [Monosiga brevicollis MX1]